MGETPLTEESSVSATSSFSSDVHRNDFGTISIKKNAHRFCRPPPLLSTWEGSCPPSLDQRAGRHRKMTVDPESRHTRNNVEQSFSMAACAAHAAGFVTIGAAHFCRDQIERH